MILHIFLWLWQVFTLSHMFVIWVVQEGNYSGFCEALAVGGCQDAAISVTLAQPQDSTDSGEGSNMLQPGAKICQAGAILNPALNESHYISIYIYICIYHIYSIYIYHIKQRDFVFDFTILYPSASHLLLNLHVNNSSFSNLFPVPWGFGIPFALECKAGARLPFNWR